MKHKWSVLVMAAIGCLLLNVGPASAQWSLNGVKVYYNAGNVGIGTNNPAYSLEVQSVGTRAIYGYAKAASGTTYGMYGQSASNTGRGIMALANAASGITFGVYSQANSTSGRGVYSLANATTGTNFAVYGQTNSAAGYSGYFAGGRNYLQGDTGIGVTTPTAKLDVLQSVAASTALMVRSPTTRIIAGYGNGSVVVGPVDAIAGVAFTAENPGGAGTQLAVIGHQVGNVHSPKIKMGANSTSIVGSLGVGVANPLFQLQLSADSAAKPTSGAWTISSDARLKKNVHTIDGALDQLLRLRGVTYQWRDPASQGDMSGTYTGMIAQEVEPVFPEWIREDANGYKTMTVIGFEGLAVEALRGLRIEKDKEIAALRAENSTQQKLIDDLSARLAKLEVAQLKAATSVTSAN